MKKLCIPAALAIVALAVGGCAGPPRNPEAEQAGAEAAQTWAKLMDSGDYSQSWTNAAAYFRNAVKEADWTRMARGARAPLGAMVSRELRSARYLTTLPGTPDGEYVVAQFNASFKNKKSSVETITVKKAADGAWRVSGYFIK